MRTVVVPSVVKFSNVAAYLGMVDYYSATLSGEALKPETFIRPTVKTLSPIRFPR